MADDSKLTRVDECCLDAHSKLSGSDECYFWREYASGRDYRFGPGNDLISNLKKKPTSSAAELRHKNRVIEECSQFFAKSLNPKWLNTTTFVPTPPSKIKSHPDYDDRITRICKGIRSQPPLDVRELVVQSKSLQAAHEVAPGHRPTVEDLLAVWQIDEALTASAPTRITIVDDVLTAGVHYRAMHTILSSRFPSAKIIGLFVARRIIISPFEPLET